MNVELIDGDSDKNWKKRLLEFLKNASRDVALIATLLWPCLELCQERS